MSRAQLEKRILRLHKGGTGKALSRDSRMI